MAPAEPASQGQRPWRLAILATHPIQYQAPWFKALAQNERVDLEVLYCHQASPAEQAAAGFGVAFEWDIPLLDGYAYRFLKNVAQTPDVSHYGGLDTPEVATLISHRGYNAVIVHGWHYKSAWQAIWSCWRSGTPVLVRGDSQLTTARSPLTNALKYGVYRVCIPRFDACLAVGRRSHDYFLYYGASPKRVFCVPHVVDGQRFTDAARHLEPTRLDIRRAWGLPDESCVYLFAGKFIPKKRPWDFIQAVAQAARRGAPASGLMVGDGPLRASCEARAAANDLPITFSGFLNQSEIVRAYVAADALVLPSDGGETWGLVVNEAMACGRPCIVSDQAGCAPDMIEPGRTGARFRMGDSQALGALLYDFATRPGALDQMRQDARTMATRYLPPTAVKGTLQALAAVSGAT